MLIIYVVVSITTAVYSYLMEQDNQQSQNNEIFNSQQTTNQQAPNIAQTTATINPSTELINQPNNNPPNKLSQTIQTNGKAKILVLLIVFILSMGTLFSSISTILKNSKAKNWPNTNGIIVKTDTSYRNTRRGVTNVYIAEYEVEGRKYTLRFTSKSGKLNTNTNVNVAYNTSNPNDAVIIGESGTTFYNYILLFAGIILAPLSAFGIFKAFINKS